MKNYRKTRKSSFRNSLENLVVKGAVLSSLVLPLYPLNANAQSQFPTVEIPSQTVVRDISVTQLDVNLLPGQNETPRISELDIKLSYSPETPISLSENLPEKPIPYCVLNTSSGFDELVNEFISCDNKECRASNTLTDFYEPFSSNSEPQRLYSCEVRLYHPPKGIYPINCTAQAFDTEGNEIPINCQYGVINVLEPTPTKIYTRPYSTTTPTPTPTLTPVPYCTCDCNNDRKVTIDELLKSVDIVLDYQNLGSCPKADPNYDGRVTIDEIITGVNNSLYGCR